MNGVVLVVAMRSTQVTEQVTDLGATSPIFLILAMSADLDGKYTLTVRSPIFGVLFQFIETRIYQHFLLVVYGSAS